MNVVPLQLFVSLLLVAASVLLFIFSTHQRDHEHAERLSLAPLDEDDPPNHTTQENPPCTSTNPTQQP